MGNKPAGRESVLPSLSQACRGSQHDVPVVPLDVVDHRTDKLDNVTQVDAASVYTLPAGADFLMCYSVAEGERADADWSPWPGLVA